MQVGELLIVWCLPMNSKWHLKIPLFLSQINMLEYTLNGALFQQRWKGRFTGVPYKTCNYRGGNVIILVVTATGRGVRWPDFESSISCLGLVVAKGRGSAAYLRRWKAKQWQVLGHGGFDRPGDGVMMTYITTSTSLSTPSPRPES